MIWLRALLLCIIPLAAMGQQRDENEGPSVGLAFALDGCFAPGRPRTTTLPEGCLGQYARPCLSRPHNQTTAGIERCHLDELRAWELLLDRYLGERRRGTPGRVLLEVQETWQSYRDAECGFFRTFYEGGSMARIMEVQCRVEVTARRAAVVRFFRE